MRKVSFSILHYLLFNAHTPGACTKGRIRDGLGFIQNVIERTAYDLHSLGCLSNMSSCKIAILHQNRTERSNNFALFRVSCNI
ncbi:hypothetical protein B0O99DRAFT_638834, partial [Bisporella sp. PMI_857]